VKKSIHDVQCMIFALKMSVLNFLQFQSFEYTQVDFNLDTFAFI